jgi:adenylosuccinate lyase
MIALLPLNWKCKKKVLHEAIREHSMEAGKRVKMEGAQNDLLDRIAQDPLFAAVHDSLNQLLDPALFVGKRVKKNMQMRVACFCVRCMENVCIVCLLHVCMYGSFLIYL